MFHAIYWFQPNPGPMTPRAWLFYLPFTLVFVWALGWSSWYLFIRQRKTAANILKNGKEITAAFVIARPPQGGRSNLPVRNKGLLRFARNDKLNYYSSLTRLAWFELAVGLMGLLLVITRLAMIPGWSARAWPMLMTALAAAGPLAIGLSRQPCGPLNSMFDLLALRQVGPPLIFRRQAVLWLLHGLGLMLWTQALGWPMGWAALIWVGLLGGQLIVAVLQATRTFDRPRLYVTPLLPLFGAYVAAGLFLLLNLHRDPFPMPLHPGLVNIWLLPFYLPAVTGAAILYALLVNLFLLFGRRVWLILPAAIAIIALLWLGAELFIHRTRGVTGTDPFGYTQVAVDLIENRTPLHRFNLFPHLTGVSIPWAAVVAQGYHLPLNKLGDAASVWPPGMSILLAVGYWLSSESGLYLTGPLLTLLTSLVVGWLGWEMARGQKYQAVTGVIALAVWATSFEVVDRSLLPMADVPAATFSAVVWLALLRMQHTRRLWPAAVIAGLALGLAFMMRYTQIMLVVSIGLAALLFIAGNRRRGLWLAATGGAALLAALPDVAYRWQVFGGPWANPQARELTHFAAAHIIPTLKNMGQALTHSREFGLLLPFLLAGIIRQWRQNRPAFWVLTGGALAVTLPQLWYEALLARDLLFLFPLFCGWVGLGVVWWGEHLASKRVGAVAAIALIFLALLLPTVRAMPLLTRIAVPHAASFGYVTATERAAFDHLAHLTPDTAAVGAQLNGGAITLHSRRQPFYPGGWTPAELDCFLDCMAQAGVPVFLLDDGPAVGPALDRLRHDGQIQPVSRLDVPLHKDGGSGQLYRVLPGNTYHCGVHANH